MGVNLQIDFRSGAPIYLQIVDQIKQMLLQGLLKPDDQLPTVRQMAAELRVNFNTIARAYRILDEAGLISTQQGRGTYILAEPDKEAVDFIREATLEELTRKYIGDATQFGCDAQEIRRVLEQELNQKEPNHKEGRKDDGNNNEIISIEE
jgi:GntR family transcriptional regulator